MPLSFEAVNKAKQYSGTVFDSNYETKSSGRVSSPAASSVSPVEPTTEKKDTSSKIDGIFDRLKNASSNAAANKSYFPSFSSSNISKEPEYSPDGSPIPNSRVNRNLDYDSMVDPNTGIPLGQAKSHSENLGKNTLIGTVVGGTVPIVYKAFGDVRDSVDTTALTRVSSTAKAAAAEREKIDLEIRDLRHRAEEAGGIENVEDITVYGENGITYPMSAKDRLAELEGKEYQAALDVANAYREADAKAEDVIGRIKDREAKRADSAMGVWAAGIVDNASKQTGLNKEASELAINAMEMGPSMIVGGLLGPVFGKIVFAAGVQARSFKEAINHGADYHTALAKSYGDMAIELGSEQVFGVVPGLGKGVLDDVVDPYIKAFGEKLGAVAARNIPYGAIGNTGFKWALGNLTSGAARAMTSPVGKFVIKTAVNANEEGIEEVISEFFTPYLDRATINPNAQNATLSDYARAYTGGAVMGAFFSAAGSFASSQSIKYNSVTEERNDVLNQYHYINQCIDKGVDRVTMDGQTLPEMPGTVLEPRFRERLKKYSNKNVRTKADLANYIEDVKLCYEDQTAFYESQMNNTPVEFDVSSIPLDKTLRKVTGSDINDAAVQQYRTDNPKTKASDATIKNRIAKAINQQLVDVQAAYDKTVAGIETVLNDPENADPYLLEIYRALQESYAQSPEAANINEIFRETVMQNAEVDLHNAWGDLSAMVDPQAKFNNSVANGTVRADYGDDIADAYEKSAYVKEMSQAGLLRTVGEDGSVTYMSLADYFDMVSNGELGEWRSLPQEAKDSIRASFLAEIDKTHSEAKTRVEELNDYFEKNNMNISVRLSGDMPERALGTHDTSGDGTVITLNENQLFSQKAVDAVVAHELVHEAYTREGAVSLDSLIQEVMDKLGMDYMTEVSNYYASYLNFLTSQYVASGMSETDAAARAESEFDISKAKEETAANFVESMFSDVDVIYALTESRPSVVSKVKSMFRTVPEMPTEFESMQRAIGAQLDLTLNLSGVSANSLLYKHLKNYSYLEVQDYIPYNTGRFLFYDYRNRLPKDGSWRKWLTHDWAKWWAMELPTPTEGITSTGEIIKLTPQQQALAKYAAPIYRDAQNRLRAIYRGAAEAVGAQHPYGYGQTGVFGTDSLTSAAYYSESESAEEGLANASVLMPHEITESKYAWAPSSDAESLQWGKPKHGVSVFFVYSANPIVLPVFGRSWGAVDIGLQLDEFLPGSKAQPYKTVVSKEELAVRAAELQDRLANAKSAVEEDAIRKEIDNLSKFSTDPWSVGFKEYHDRGYMVPIDQLNQLAGALFHDSIYCVGVSDVYSDKGIREGGAYNYKGLAVEDSSGYTGVADQILVRDPAIVKSVNNPDPNLISIGLGSNLSENAYQNLDYFNSEHTPLDYNNIDALIAGIESVIKKSDADYKYYTELKYNIDSVRANSPTGSVVRTTDDVIDPLTGEHFGNSLVALFCSVWDSSDRASRYNMMLAYRKVAARNPGEQLIPINSIKDVRKHIIGKQSATAKTVAGFSPTKYYTDQSRNLVGYEALGNRAILDQYNRIGLSDYDVEEMQYRFVPKAFNVVKKGSSKIEMDPDYANIPTRSPSKNDSQGMLDVVFAENTNESEILDDLYTSEVKSILKNSVLSGPVLVKSQAFKDVMGVFGIDVDSISNLRSEIGKAVKSTKGADHDKMSDMSEDLIDIMMGLEEVASAIDAFTDEGIDIDSESAINNLVDYMRENVIKDIYNFNDSYSSILDKYFSSTAPLITESNYSPEESADDSSEAIDLGEYEYEVNEDVIKLYKTDDTDKLNGLINNGLLANLYGKNITSEEAAKVIESMNDNLPDESIQEACNYINDSLLTLAVSLETNPPNLAHMFGGKFLYNENNWNGIHNFLADAEKLVSDMEKSQNGTQDFFTNYDIMPESQVNDSDLVEPYMLLASLIENNGNAKNEGKLYGLQKQISEWKPKLDERTENAREHWRNVLKLEREASELKSRLSGVTESGRVDASSMVNQSLRDEYKQTIKQLKQERIEFRRSMRERSVAADRMNKIRKELGDYRKGFNALQRLYDDNMEEQQGSANYDILPESANKNKGVGKALSSADISPELAKNIAALRTELQKKYGLGLNTAAVNQAAELTQEEADKQFKALGDKYGVMADGTTPKKSSSDKKVGKIAKTVYNNKNTSEQMKAAERRMIVSGELSYTPRSNNATMKKAYEWYNKNYKVTNPDGTVSYNFNEAATDYIKKGRDNGINSMDDIAKGALLLNQLAGKELSDFELAAYEQIVSEMNVNARRMGQAIQAVTLINKMTPAGRLYYLERNIDSLMDELAKNNSKGASALAAFLATDEYADLRAEYDKAKTAKDVTKIEQKIINRLADMIPPTIGDRVRAWRYLCMLGNLRTHGRNIASNAAMLIAGTIRHEMAAFGEDVIGVFAPNMNRTKTLRPATKAQREFAQRDFQTMKDYLQFGGKTGFDTMLSEAKRSFGKTPPGRLLQALADINGGALEAEDVAFMKFAYRRAMSSWLAANPQYSIEFLESNTPESNDVLSEARAKAAAEAWEATYRSFNALAMHLNQIENGSPYAKLIIGGLVPFKRTPVNILKTGVRYSPVGLFDALIRGSYELKKGKITASEWINNVSKGLTGSGILALGLAAGMSGIAKGSGSDDDKEEYYDQMKGEQRYSIKIGDTSYTLDWLTPISMPFFAGVELAGIFSEASDEDDDEYDFNAEFNRYLSALTLMADPVMNLSMLQSLNEALSSYEDNQIGALITSAAESYALQFVPTWAGQTIRTIDPVRRTTYAPKDSDYPMGKKGEQFVNKLRNKSLIARKILGENEPYIDMWGRQEVRDGSLPRRMFEQFVSPGYFKDSNVTAVDDKLTEIFAQTKERAVLPKLNESYLSLNGKDYYLSAKEYTEVKTQIGQTNYKSLEEAFRSNLFKTLDVDTQAEVVKDIYDYSKKQARFDYALKHGIKIDNMSSFKILDKVRLAQSTGINIGEAIIINKMMSQYHYKSEKQDFANSLGLSERQFEIFYKGE